MIEKIKLLAWEELKIYDDLLKKLIDKIGDQTNKNKNDILDIKSSIDDIVNTDISIERPENQAIGDIWIVETERE